MVNKKPISNRETLGGAEMPPSSTSEYPPPNFITPQIISQILQRLDKIEKENSLVDGEESGLKMTKADKKIMLDYFNRRVEEVLYVKLRDIVNIHPDILQRVGYVPKE